MCRPCIGDALRERGETALVEWAWGGKDKWEKGMIWEKEGSRLVIFFGVIIRQSGDIYFWRESLAIYSHFFVDKIARLLLSSRWYPFFLDENIQI